MKKFLDMIHDKSKTMWEYIMKMMDITAQLRFLEVDISESFLVHFILNSLPLEYGPFNISYYTHKEKWLIKELLTMCV